MIPTPNATPCAACPLRRRAIFEPFTADEVDFMQRFKVGELVVERGATILKEGTKGAHLFTVLRGQGIRYTLLEDGRRQVINFLFPGDFAGLQAGLMGEMKHSVEASSDMVLCVFNRKDLWMLFEKQPNRAFDLTWMSAVEEHLLGESLATLGQRDAVQRVAWALLRMFERLGAVGLLQGASVPLPFRQQDLADSLGLSLVHTNKTLTRLRDAGLAQWREGRLTVPDRGKLATLALVDLERPEVRPLM